MQYDDEFPVSPRRQLPISLEERVVHLEEQNELLIQQLRDLRQGTYESFLRSSSHWRTVEEERAQALRESNALLREEIRVLARLVGAKPPLHAQEQDYANYVPIEATFYRKATAPKLQQPAEVVGALRTMVRAAVRENLTTSSLASPQAVAKYVDETLGANVRSLVRNAVGIDPYGKIDQKSPLAIHIQELVNPLVADALPSLAAVASEGVQETLTSESFLSDFRGKAVDFFVRTLRSKIEELAAEKATEMAQRVTNEAAEEAILEELPWLKRYVVANRLGRDNDDV